MDQARVPAQPLRIRNTRERQFFRMVEMLLDLAVEQAQLPMQRSVAVCRQGLDKVFDHRT